MKRIRERYKTIRDNSLRGAFVTDDRGYTYPKPLALDESGKIDFISFPKVNITENPFSMATLFSPSDKTRVLIFGRKANIEKNFILSRKGEYMYYVPLDGNHANVSKDNIAYVTRDSYYNWERTNLREILPTVKKNAEGLPVNWDGLDENTFKFFLDVQEWKKETRKAINKSIAVKNASDGFHESVEEDVQEQDELLNLSDSDIGAVKDAFYDEKLSLLQISGILKISKETVRSILMEDEIKFIQEIQSRSRSQKITKFD